MGSNKMQSANLANLQAPEGSRKNKTRKGRGLGSGLGKTAGRGYKGQTSRSGSKRRVGFEGGQIPLYRRIPKFGFKSPFRTSFEVINLFVLEERFNDGDVVDIALLMEKGLVRSKRHLIKILGNGALTKKLTVKAHKFSKSAIQKINQAGGQAEELGILPSASDQPSEE